MNAVQNLSQLKLTVLTWVFMYMFDGEFLCDEEVLSLDCDLGLALAYRACCCWVAWDEEIGLNTDPCRFKLGRVSSSWNISDHRLREKRVFLCITGFNTPLKLLGRGGSPDKPAEFIVPENSCKFIWNKIQHDVGCSNSFHFTHSRV